MVAYGTWEGVIGPMIGLAVRALFGPTPVMEAVVPLLGPVFFIGL